MPATRTSRHFIGVDVGGTKIAAGIVSFPLGRIISQRVIPTDAHRGSAAVLDNLGSMLGQLTRESNVKYAGLGMGVCELISARGHIMSSATLKWNSRQVRKKLAPFGPVTIDADVRAAGLAEAMFGAGSKYRNFLFVTIGTGISCSLVIEGRPYRGTRGATGTMASAALTHRCERCRHIQKQSIEELASGPGLVKRFQRAGGLAQRAEDVVRSDSYAAMEVLEEGGQGLANALALLVDVLDPQAVIVAGGLGLVGGIYWKSLVAHTRQTIWSQVSRRIPIRRATLGREAGIIGAAAAAWLNANGRTER